MLIIRNLNLTSGSILDISAKTRLNSPAPQPNDLLLSFEQVQNLLATGIFSALSSHFSSLKSAAQY